MAAEAIKVGSRLGPYELLSPIGAGGMGEVWKARDTRLDRVVAVKFSQAQFTDRFEREARAIAALNHPNIAQIYDVGENYIVMEYVEAEPIGPPDSTRKLLDIAVQIADGLAAAHAGGFVHRDLKPDNILITKSGRVKILDFGLAKQAEASAGEATRTIAITNPGAVLGTVAYMSPEQARGQELDARSDQFSFGLILYELAAGKRAFVRESSAETMTAIIREDPEPLAASLPVLLRWTIERLLSKDPEDRYASTKDLFAELRGIRTRLSELSSVPIVAFPVPNERHSWRVPVAVLLAALAGAVVALWLWPRESPLDPKLQATPLATEKAAESWAHFSPDGQSIAYGRMVAGVNQIFVRPLTQGQATQLTHSPTSATVVSWSRDGESVYYTTNKLWAISASGGEPREVKCDVKGLANRLRFLPGEKSVISVGQLKGKDGATLFQLQSWPVGGGGPTVIAALPFHDDLEVGQLAISPEGTKVLVSRVNGPAMLISYPEGKVRNVPSVRDCYFVDWMPDSRHVVYTGAEGEKIMIADTESDAWQLLLKGVKEPALNHVSVNRAGTGIAYGEIELDFDILDFSLDGRYVGDLRTTSSKEYQADWSPKGDAFAHFEERTGIWIRQADNSSARVLVRDPDAVRPAFSPDGQRIAFRRRGGLFAVLAEGGPISVIRPEYTQAKGRAGSVCWSPDGKWIAYSEGSREGGLSKIESSGNRQPIRLAPSSNAFGTWCDWSADGRSIIYQSSAGVSIVSAEGGNARLLHRGRAAAFLPSGEAVIAYTEGDAPSLVRVDPASGRRIASVPLAIPAGYSRSVSTFSVHPDGQRLPMSISRSSADIMLLEGFAQPETGWRRLFRHWKTAPISE